MCHSFATITVSFTWCVLTTSMTVMAFRIRKTTKILNAQMLDQMNNTQTTHRQRHVVRQVIKARTKSVKRMSYVTKVIVCVAVFLFFYTCYKYFFYSGDCCPLNYMSSELNSLLNLIGLGTDFIFWLIPVIIFFWPTKHYYHDEVQYRHAKRSWSTLESSRHSSLISNAIN